MQLVHLIHHPGAIQLVHQILYLDEDRAVRAAFWLLCLIFLSFRYSGIARAALKSKQLLWSVAGLGLVLTSTFVLGASLYLLYPNYIDHIEPTVSSISWWGTHGHAIYP